MAKKRAILLVFLFCSMLFLAGCETIKGAFSGASSGVKKDWEASKRVDTWMRENLW